MLDVIASTIDNNEATVGGGLYAGVFNPYGQDPDETVATLRLTNSTVSENLAIQRYLDGAPVLYEEYDIPSEDYLYGGGIAGDKYSDLQIRHSTVTQNFTYQEESESSGVFFQGHDLDIGHTIIADNPDAFVDDDPQSFTYDPVASSDLDSSFSTGDQYVEFSFIGDILWSGLTSMTALH